MKRMSVRCYTLVELLIVIAIIMILAGILVPTLKSSRDSARKAQCLSNQKNIGVYAYNYAYNNNQSIAVLQNWQTWYRDLLKSNGGLKDGQENTNDYMLADMDKRSACLTSEGLGMTKVFKCPSDTSGGTASYARNDPNGGGTMKWNGNTPDKNLKIVTSRLNDFRGPSDLILTSDRWSANHIPGQSCNSSTGGEYDITNAFHLRRRESGAGIEGDRDKISRHKGDAPILYVDGHVTAVDYLTTIPKAYHPKSATDLGKLSELNWSSGYAVGSWTDEPTKKK